MKMLIGGEWIDKDKRIEVTNPYDGSLVDHVPHGDREDVNAALKGARNGLDELDELGSYGRYKVLLRTAELMEERLEEFAVTMSKEVGKTIKEARGEVRRAIQTLTLSAEEAKRIYGETIPFDAAPGGQSKMGFAMRVPVGIVAAISPFNFPLNLVAHKVAPALAAANAVVVKPATATPLSALFLARALNEAGLPPHALSVVTGPGRAIGDALVTDERVRMITFTGSLEVGKGICSKAGLKRLTMELGSNSACVLMPDAPIERAVNRIALGGYALAGQVCISVQRVFVHRSIFDQFHERFIPKVKSLIWGDPMDEGTDMGPMIDEPNAIRIKDWIDEAISAGATLATGGGRQGTLVEPTVLLNVPRECRVHHQEAFGPVVCINPFETLDEAIELVNDSAYGLQAGIFTYDYKSALQAARQMEVGGVMVNEVPTYRADLMPYGGMKGSGLGREGPRYAIQEMTELKAVGFELE
jgi:glyceraldehyde-3-phosphate dehydrogenase (NADP+)